MKAGLAAASAPTTAAMPVEGLASRASAQARLSSVALNISFVPGNACAYENSPTTFLSEPTCSLSTLRSPTADARDTDAEVWPETVAFTV